jgi:PGF-CTERM protein
MKSMTKLMVVAMLLVAALVVAPAAARTYVGNHDDGIGKFAIAPSDTVYVGEQHLNFAAGWTADLTAGARFVHYTDTTKGTYDKAVTISSPDDFELTSSDFGTTTGTYYVFPITASISDPVPAGTQTLYVDIPKVTLDVVLQKSLIDSVNGKTVTRDNALAFKLQNNLGGFSDVVNGSTGPTGTPPENYQAQPKMKIEVTLPGGGVTTKFGTVGLAGIAVNGTTVYKNNIILEDEKAGKYTAVAKWPSSGPGASFYGKNYDSNPVTFEILTKKLAISADKDTVVRGKSFSVTITGESKQPYFLFVKDAGLKAADEYPTIRSNQNGVKNDTKADYTGIEWDTLLKNVDNKTVPNYAGTHAFVETNAGGTRTVQFDTVSETDDRQFTIRVQDLVNKGTYDEVKVKVEKGTVTVTASGTGVYYLGEEITLSGTNTDSDYVYLFLTGPNLGTNGVNLETLKKVTDNTKEQGLDGSFTRETVEADDTWSYKWNTAELGKVLDAGGYTIYAASEPQGKDNLSDVEYATASVRLKSAYLTATSSGAKIAKGDDLKITGTAQGDPDNVQVWIFGKNYYGKNNQLVDTATVESDGSFEYELKSGETKELSPGQYFAVIQHPMTNGYGVTATGTKIFAEDLPVGGVDLGKLQASAAATALINALDSPNVDDTYVKLTFDVEEAYITIDPIGDKEAGSKFTISGTTNVAVGDKLIIDVTSAAFGPAKKTEAAGFGSVSGTATVEKGDGANKWSFEVDAADLKPDQYIVKAECIETSTTTTANFNLVEAVETTPTTEVETTAPVGEETTTVPAGEETTEPTPIPGFGALVALAGLGAVAFLVLRRD